MSRSFSYASRIPNPDAAVASEDAAVFAFLCACPLPSRDDVAEWGRRYPAHAEAIAEYAAISLEAAFSRDMSGIDPEESDEADERADPKRH